ncbi:MAG: pentapeptide repeat-containing protein [Methylococcales bacterium]
MNPRSHTRFPQNRETRNINAELLRLDKIVEDSSEKNRNFFAAYLGLLIYVQAIVFSTTDLNLLHSVDGLKLPIIDITLPLVGFYAVIPFFIIALHFNFLQNLESHHYKLMRWQEAHPNGKVPRSSIQPFLFDYSILEKEGQMVRLVSWANNLLCYNFAPITLGILLIRFSDIQEPSITIFHYLAFVFDSWLVWKLRLAIKDNNNIHEPPSVATIRGFISDIPREGLRGRFGFLVFFLTLDAVLVGWASRDQFVNYVQPLFARSSTVTNKNEPWVIRHILELFLPRIAIDPSESVWQPDVKAQEIDAKLADSDTNDWVKYFNENGKGFLPTAISLRLASLPSQNLRKAQLYGVQLQGADLSHAQLQGADLRFAQLQEAELNSVHLYGAQLQAAQMQGAIMYSANLQGTDLSGVKLQGANLSRAQLQGASLHGADLKGADLKGADLQGADLRWADLRGADMGKADLQGAIMDQTLIFGILNPTKATVFSIPYFFKEQDDHTFDTTDLTNWQFFVGGYYPFLYEGSNDFNARMQQAQHKPSLGAMEAWQYHTTTIVPNTLSIICQSDLKPQEVPLGIQDESQAPREDAQAARLAAANGFRDNYNSIVYAEQAIDFFYRHPPEYYSRVYARDDYRRPPEVRKLLKNIDHSFCTLDVCKDLRRGIEGLVCAVSEQRG